MTMAAEECFTHVFSVGRQVVTAKVRRDSYRCTCDWGPGNPPDLTKLPDRERREYMQGMEIVHAEIEQRFAATKGPRDAANSTSGAR